MLAWAVAQVQVQVRQVQVQVQQVQVQEPEQEPEQVREHVQFRRAPQGPSRGSMVVMGVPLAREAHLPLRWLPEAA